MNKILLKWSAIERLGNSKISKSSYYWFFIIPIIAKLFQKIPTRISIDSLFIESLTSQPIELTLSFPFKWYLIFLIGIFFIISNIIYQISCPHIVREFRNYSEFVSSGYPNSYLLAQADFHKVTEDAINAFVRFMPVKDGFDADIKRPFHEKEYHFRNVQKEFFDRVFNIANESKLYVRLLATIIISIAFILLTVIVFQNIITVIEIYNNR